MAQVRSIQVNSGQFRSIQVNCTVFVGRGIIKFTRQDGRMSRAFVSCSVRSGDLDLTVSNPGRVKPRTYKLTRVASQPGVRYYYDRARTGGLSVRIM